MHSVHRLRGFSPGTLVFPSKKRKKNNVLLPAVGITLKCNAKCCLKFFCCVLSFLEWTDNQTINDILSHWSGFSGVVPDFDHRRAAAAFLLLSTTLSNNTEYFIWKWSFLGVWPNTLSKNSVKLRRKEKWFYISFLVLFILSSVATVTLKK